MIHVLKYFPHDERNQFLECGDFRALPNSNRWVVTERLRYIDPEGKEIIVPVGFVTDFASVPPLARFGAIAACVFQFCSQYLWWMIFPELFALWVCFVAEWMENSGTDEIAAVHDFLYATRLFPRWRCDWILFCGMAAKGATRNPLWKRFMFWFNVRAFGFVPWADDARKPAAK